MFREDDGYLTPSDRIGHIFVYVYIALGVMVSISILLWVQSGFTVNGTYLENLNKLLRIFVTEVTK